MEVKELTIKKIHEGLKRKAFSAKEITDAYLANIGEKNTELNAVLETFTESARAQAQRVDELLAQGASPGMLTGVPIVIKDNILISGKIASAASRMLEHYRAVYDAGVIEKLKGQHAIFLGRTNMDEFAMGSSTENSAFGTVKNPADPERVPGGSSGGSTAAVAADMATAALGSDTGGSIRQPAHLCGVVGLKPTYGAVSRSGLIAMASSLDQIGPITKTVEDAAYLFNVIKGKDPHDNTTQEGGYDNELINPSEDRLKTLRIGIPEEYFGEGIEPEVRAAVDSVRKFFAAQGLAITSVRLPHTKYALSTYYIIMPAEVSSNLARFDGIRYAPAKGVDWQSASLLEIYKNSKSEGFGPETKRRIMLGTYVLSSGYYDAYYKKALEAKEYISDDFNAAFKEVDVLLTPVAPTRAFKIGEKAADPLAMYLSDILTIPANLAGLPAISIPVKNISGLPIGFQLIGKHFKEADILGLGRLYESQ